MEYPVILLQTLPLNTSYPSTTPLYDQPPTNYQRDEHQFDGEYISSHDDISDHEYILDHEDISGDEDTSGSKYTSTEEDLTYPDKYTQPEIVTGEYHTGLVQEHPLKNKQKHPYLTSNRTGVFLQ